MGDPIFILEIICFFILKVFNLINYFYTQNILLKKQFSTSEKALAEITRNN